MQYYLLVMILYFCCCVQEVSNLALHIVRQMYGEQVEYISKILLRNGPSTIVDIIARVGTNFDHSQVRAHLPQACNTQIQLNIILQ